MRQFKEYYNTEDNSEIMLDKKLYSLDRNKYEIIKPLTRIEGKLKVRPADKLHKFLWR